MRSPVGVPEEEDLIGFDPDELHCSLSPTPVQSACGSVTLLTGKTGVRPRSHN